MRTILSTLIFVFGSFYFVACSSDEQNGTDQNAPNTLESLINQNANSATSPSTATKISSGSLQDTWVLARIGGTVNYEVNLANNIPILTLDTVANTMSGHTGCNSIDGKLNIKGNKILSTDLKLTSNQPCSDKGFEKKMVSSFKSGNTTYKLANDTLYLNVGGGTEFVYRRISRG
jgi:heat shock protein HslJ